MDFVELVRSIPVGDIVASLGAPERTVYSWRMGDRLPPEWVQRLVVARLKRRAQPAARAKADKSARLS